MLESSIFYYYRTKAFKNENVINDFISSPEMNFILVYILNETNEIISIVNLLMKLNNGKISIINKKNKQIIFGTFKYDFYIYII